MIFSSSSINRAARLPRIIPALAAIAAAVRVREAGKSMAGVFLKAVCRLDSSRPEPWCVPRHEEAKE